MTMPHLMNCAHSDDGWCLDCVEELWNKTQVAPEMLEAATAAMLKSQEYGTGESPTVYTQEAFQAANLAATWRLTERYAKAALEAAGVPALLARIAELEQRETRIMETIATEGFPLRPDLAQFFNERVEYFTAQESPRDEAVALAWSDYLIETLKRVMK